MGDACWRKRIHGAGMAEQRSAPPAIGTRIQVQCDDSSEGPIYEPAIVVGHLTDPIFGTALELKLTDRSRIQRLWPSSQIRIPTHT